jgi:DNA-binding LacI/PurR family transcriptional regulator
MTTRKRMTLADVAKVAGVSVMTVSNVASGKSSLVREETRKHVQAVITKLGYRPNLNARGLRLALQRSVGIVIADTDPAFLTDPFISRLVSGLSNYLSSLDYTLDVQGIAPDRFEHATILNKVGNDAICAVLCGPKTLRRKQLDHLVRIGQPTVVFQEVFASPSPNVAVIRQNDFQAGQFIGDYLLTQKVKSILFVRPTLDWCAVEQREKGLRAAALSSAAQVRIDTIQAPSEGLADVRSAVRAAVATHMPDVIVAATDSMAVAVLKEVESLGIRVPEQLRIAGFNGFDVWQFTRPTLTTVVSPAYDIGRISGEFLVNRLQTGNFAKRNIVLPVRMQSGESA